MKKKNKPLILAAAICLVSVILMIAALANPKVGEPQAFTPPPFEDTAVSGVPAVPEGLGWGELDAKVYKASVCGVIRVEDGSADVWFTNPESNTVWLKLRILDKNGNILGETGIIKPGEYVQSIVFDTVPASGQAISMKLMAYEPETYHSAGVVTLNTTIAK
jgi:NADPH-dependent 2,4-dienoyl-CoA reductase/sulfur reductase-like enzyme